MIDKMTKEFNMNREEYECCNPNYANSGVLGVSEKVKYEMMKKELEVIVVKASDDESYIPLYSQIFGRLVDDAMKKEIGYLEVGNLEAGSFGQFEGDLI